MAGLYAWLGSGRGIRRCAWQGVFLAMSVRGWEVRVAGTVRTWEVSVAGRCAWPGGARGWEVRVVATVREYSQHHFCIIKYSLYNLPQYNLQPDIHE